MAAGLSACTDERHAMGVLAGQQVGGNSAGSAGADLGDGTGFHHGSDQRVFRLKENDIANVAGIAGAHVGGIGGDDLRAVEIPHIGGHEAELGSVGHHMDGAQGHHVLALLQGGEGFLHRGDALFSSQQLPYAGFFDNQHDIASLVAGTLDFSVHLFYNESRNGKEHVPDEKG